MQSRLFDGLLALLCCALCLVCLSASPSPAPGDPQSAARWKAWRADLDSLYQEIEQPSELRSIFKHKGIDWRDVKKRADTRFKQARSAAKKRKSGNELADGAAFYDVLRFVIGQLRDSHARLEVEDAVFEEWRKSQPAAFDAGIEFLPGSHGMILVANTFAARGANSPLYQKGVRHEQSVLESVNGRPATEYFEHLAHEILEQRGWQSTYERAYIEALNGLSMADGEALKLVVKTLAVADNLKQRYLAATEKQRKKQIKRFKWKSRKVSLRSSECSKSKNARNFRCMALEQPELHPTSDPAIGYAKLPSGNGYVRYGAVSGKSRAGLQEACEALADCPGLILDMRLNGGGGESGVRVFDKHDGAWAKPVAVLIGPKAMSAAETELWTLLQMRAARATNVQLFGRSTAGSSGAKQHFSLPSGFAKGRFVIRHWHGGRSRIEGYGIAPDVVVDQDIVELSLGIDSCLRVGEAWLADQ